MEKTGARATGMAVPARRDEREKGCCVASEPAQIREVTAGTKARAKRAAKVRAEEERGPAAEPLPSVAGPARATSAKRLAVAVAGVIVALAALLLLRRANKTKATKEKTKATKQKRKASKNKAAQPRDPKSVLTAAVRAGLMAAARSFVKMATSAFFGGP